MQIQVGIQLYILKWVKFLEQTKLKIHGVSFFQHLVDQYTDSKAKVSFFPFDSKTKMNITSALPRMFLSL